MNTFYLNLHLFDDGGAPAGESGATTAESANAEVQGQSVNEEVAEPQSEVSTEQADERINAYNEFKKANKDLFDKDFSTALDKRFKNSKKAEKELETFKTQQSELEPMLELLKVKYGVKETSDLVNAITEDNSFYEQAAYEAGLSVEQYKAMQKLERENSELRKAREDLEAKQHQDQIYNQWLEQADKTKQLFPDFDIEKECESNPQFIGMLQSGIDVTTAYQALHLNDIVNGVVQLTTQETKSAVSKSISTAGKRPKENGAGAAVQTKIDINNLSDAQMKEFEKRAARGERITFT